MRCGLVSDFRHDWLSGVALTSAGVQFVVPPNCPNPFGLPQDDAPELLLIASRGVSPEGFISGLLDRFEGRIPVVGLDGADWLELGFTPQELSRLTLLVKGQGLYRDRDLYNYDVGAKFPGSWTEKRVPRKSKYRTADLEKL